MNRIFSCFYPRSLEEELIFLDKNPAVLDKSPISNNSYAFNQIPDEISRIIVNQLGNKELKVCNQVSKKLNILTSETDYLIKRAVFNHFASSPLLWNEIFGEGTVSEDELKEAFYSLPDDIQKMLSAPCRAITDKKISDTHMLFYIPRAIRENPVNLNRFNDLLKTIDEFSQRADWHVETYHWGRHENCKKTIGRSEIESGWILMMKEFLPGTFNQEDKKSIEIFESFNETVSDAYQSPTSGEALIGMSMEYFRSGSQLFTYDSLLGITLPAYVETKEYYAGWSYDGKSGPYAYCVVDSKISGIAPLIRLTYNDTQNM